jgi:hypothetical protein
MVKSVPAAASANKASSKPATAASANKSANKASSKPATDVTSLMYKIGKKAQTVDGAKLLEPDDRDALRDELADSTVVFDLDDLLDYDDPIRFAVIDLMAPLKTARFQVSEQLYQNLLDGVLAHSPVADDVARIRNYKLAALEVAVIGFPDALELVCGRLASRMKEMKITGVRMDGLLQEAKQIQAELQTAATAQETPEPVSVRSILDDAPVGAEVMVPFGWELAKNGITKVGNDEAPRIPGPIIISGRAKDVNRHEELLTIAWKRADKWMTRTVDRVEVADAKRAVSLASFGAPVNSNTVRTLVSFLSDFEMQNLAHLPMTLISRKLGWQGQDGQGGFLLGSHVVTAQGLSKADGSSGGVKFVGADEGDEQLALGFHSRGTLKGWLSAVKVLDPFPRVKFGIYAACAAPMLMILGSPNIVVSDSGPSTGGKTVKLRVAGSVWGCPDETNPNTIVNTWDATGVWRERAPGTLKDLPLILDDTMRARKPTDVQQSIFDVSQGRGRGRGTPKGLARQSAWQTVLMATGERPLTSFTEAGGTHARVLESWATSPFNAKNKETGALVRKLNRGVKRNYGFIGPLFVQFLQKNRTKWPDWRKTWRKYVREYEEKAADHAVAGRLADHFATIKLTAELVHEAIELPWAYSDPVAPLYDELIREAGQADRSAAALCHAMSWAAAHPADFYKPTFRGEERHQPPGGWAGVLPPDSGPACPDPKLKKAAKSSGFIAFFPQRLQTILNEAGYDMEATVRSWKDRGWLFVTEEGGAARSRMKIKIGKRAAWVIAIKNEAVEAAEAG